VDLPIENGEFPWFFVNAYQRVMISIPKMFFRYSLKIQNNQGMMNHDESMVDARVFHP